MNFRTITKNNLFYADIIILNDDLPIYYVVKIEKTPPKIMNETEFIEFKNLLIDLCYQIIYDGVNEIPSKLVEMWTSNDCLLIREDLYDEFIEMVLPQ